jgi:hypothetical protein
MDHKKVSIGLGFVVVFLGGALAHDFAGVVVAKTARADAATQRWAYSCTGPVDRGQLQRTATDHGAKGWEMTALVLAPPDSFVTCFKHPMP